MRYTIHDIAGILSAPIKLEANYPVEHILTDSRKVYFPASSVFFALPGNHTDGHHFIASLYQQGVRCFIETHSEHLLLRLQKQIAKTTAGEISAAQYEQMLLPNQLAVYFINRKDNVSTVTQIEVGPYGDLLSTPEGFEDFFSDDVIETAERMRTRLAGMRKNN